MITRPERTARRALAVCYRLRTKAPQGIEVVVIRTRSGLWTLPGGRVDPGETPAQAAEREAFEEAGVSGRLDPRSVGEVVLIKRPSEVLRPSMMRAPVFLLEVLAAEEPEETYRHPQWMRPADAEKRLSDGRMPWSSGARIRALHAAMRALG
ncbi:MAG: NUDIX domain-containing protein [Actinomycetota bacterium]